MKNIRLKSERLFFIFTLIYMMLFILFNVIGSIFNSVKLVDTPLTIDIIIHRLFSENVLNIISNVFIWVIISFVLIILIIMQFDLKKEKMFRSILLFELFNVMLTLLMSGICDAIITKDLTNTMLFTFYILLLWVVIVYFIIKHVVDKGNENDLKEILSAEEYKAIKKNKK